MNNSNATAYGIEVDGIHHLFLGKVPDFDSEEECKSYFLKLVKEKEQATKRGILNVLHKRQ